MFYLSSIGEIAERAMKNVLAALGMGLLDAPDDDLEAGVKAEIKRAMEDAPDYWNPSWNM